MAEPPLYRRGLRGYEPDPSILHELLIYHPRFGMLFWRYRDQKWFQGHSRSAAWLCNNWNSKFAEREAFTARDTFGHKIGMVCGKRTSAHRVAWAMTFGEWPEAIDHINGDPADNRLENLRAVSQAENCRNQKLRKNSRSGVLGVHWDAQCKKWQARIRAKGKSIHLGFFETKEDAVSARRAAEAVHGLGII